jgi:monofunctional biosynthetic peptidoglycan transglycosylase
VKIKQIAKRVGKYFVWGLASYFSMILVLLIIFRWLPIPSSSFMLQQNISAWVNADSNGTVRYEWQDWEHLPKSIALAAIAAEDQRFPQHYGLDFKAIYFAWKSTRQQKRGASTITQQVVKNLFLWGGRSYIRKGLEASISLLMELVWSKQRILEVYLNIAQFGQRDYGVKSARQFLLRKSSNRLTFSEAALLAAVLPAPRFYNINRPNRQLKRKQRWVYKQMRQLGGLPYLRRL